MLRRTCPYPQNITLSPPYPGILIPHPNPKRRKSHQVPSYRLLELCALPISPWIPTVLGLKWARSAVGSQAPFSPRLYLKVTPVSPPHKKANLPLSETLQKMTPMTHFSFSNPPCL